MLELSEEENDPSLLTEIKSSLADLDDQVTEAEFKALLSEKNDFHSPTQTEKVKKNVIFYSFSWKVQGNIIKFASKLSNSM